MQAWLQSRAFTPDPRSSTGTQTRSRVSATQDGPVEDPESTLDDQPTTDNRSGPGQKVNQNPTGRRTNDLSTPSTTSTAVATPIKRSAEVEKGRDDPGQSPIYVSFEPNDPANPQNWSRTYKSWVVVQLTWLTLSLTFASSAAAPAQDGMMAEFGCSEVTAVATTGVFLIGMGIASMPFAPLSELYGRLNIYIGVVLLATLFEIGCALAPSAPALIVLRFFAGLFSSAPLSNAGGTLFDIGNPVSRTLEFAVFASCGFVAPIIAPVMCGFVVTNPNFGWRWCFWVTAIFNATAFILVSTCMPETLGSALLKMKAMRLRKVTGDQRWRAKVEDEKLKDATIRALKRPFKMLLIEPVVQFFVVYLTVVYIVLYGTFTAYPLVFAAHGLSTRQIGLAFIPVAIGFLSVLIVAVLHFVRYRRLAHDAKKGIQRRGIWNGKVEPEERLVPLMFVAILFPAGLFWLSWTSPERYSVWLPIISGIPFGIGLLSIFQGSMQYTMDAYGPYAASALAASTLVRYCVPGLVILAYPQMYKTLGNTWATSLFAFIALALTPVPFVFYHYGRRVRERCQFTVKS